MLATACTYDTSLGVARQLDASSTTDAESPSWVTLHQVTGAHPRDVHGLSGYEVLFVGTAGAMWRWNGFELHDAAAPTGDLDLDAVWAASSLLGYAVGARLDGTPAVLQWNGAQWSAITTPADTALTGVAGIGGPGERAWSVGHASNFLHRPSSASTWERQTGPDLVVSPEAVWVSDDAGDVWVVGSQGIARYRASDTAFVERFDDVALWGVHGTAVDDVWAVGAEGAIRHWDGAAWTDVPSGVAVTLRDVWANAPDRAWAVGDAGTVLRWDGIAWQVDADFTPWDLRAIWGATETNIFAVGSAATDGVIVRYGTTEIGI